MRPSQTTDATEKRRQLLKGALGASTVVTLGYSRSAAAASVTACIANFSAEALPGQQFVNSGLNTPPDGNTFAWKEVFVNRYSQNPDGSGSKIYAVKIGDNLYQVNDKGTGPLTSSTPVTDTYYVMSSPAARKAWTLVYFSTETREEFGLYPNVAAPEEGVAPASLACLNSLNAAISGGYDFGG